MKGITKGTKIISLLLAVSFCFSLLVSGNAVVLAQESQTMSAAKNIKVETITEPEPTTEEPTTEIEVTTQEQLSTQPQTTEPQLTTQPQTTQPTTQTPPTTESITEPVYEKGDVNLDGELTVADVLLLQKHIAVLIELTGKEWEYGDFNSDRVIDIIDALWVQKIVAKLAPKESEIIKVESVELDTQDLELFYGQTHQANAVVQPNETTFGVAWSSSNIKVAAVDKTGLITTTGEGECVISCSSGFGNVGASFTVTVKGMVTGVTLNKDSIRIKPNATYTLTQTVLPAEAYVKAVTWSSSNKKIATVNAQGVVKAVGTGKCEITCTTEDGKKTAVCAVDVSVAVTGVELSKTSLTMKANRTRTFIKTISPSNATYRTVTWKSSDTSIAKIDENGVVTTLKAGSCKITVTTKDGEKTASCKLTVKAEDENDKYINKLIAKANNHVGKTGEQYLRWYYGSTYYVHWCAIFHCYVHNEAGSLYTCVPSTSGAGTVARVGVANNQGKFYLKDKTTIRRGDSLLFRYNTTYYTDKYHSDHIELVIDVDEGTNTITTIGGNVGDGSGTTDCRISTVKKRVHNLNDAILYAVYRPNYALITGVSYL